MGIISLCWEFPDECLCLQDKVDKELQGLQQIQQDKDC